MYFFLEINDEYFFLKAIPINFLLFSNALVFILVRIPEIKKIRQTHFTNDILKF